MLFIDNVKFFIDVGLVFGENFGVVTGLGVFDVFEIILFLVGLFVLVMWFCFFLFLDEVMVMRILISIMMMFVLFSIIM